MRAVAKASHNGASPRRLPGWTASLRFRLAAWYGLVVAAILSASSFSLYFAARHALIQETDQFLAAVAHRMVVSARSDPSADQIIRSEAGLSAALDARPINQANLPAYLRHPIGSLDLADTAIRVVRPSDLSPVAQSRRLIEQPDLQAALNLPLRPASRDSSYQFAEVKTAGGLRERVVTRYSRTTGLFIQVSTPWDSDAGLLTHLSTLLSVSVLLGIVLAVAGGWLIVGRSLKPVDRLVKEVETLSEDDFIEASPLVSKEADGEIGRLVAAFNHLAERLSRSLDAQRRFAQDAAHELQTPATVLQLHLEKLLRRDRPAAEVRAAVEIAHEEAGRISRIVDALSYSALSDTAIAREERSDASVDIGDLIRMTLQHYRPLAARKRIDLKTGLADGELLVAGDREELRQVIRNLLDNALKYTDSGGGIEITAAREWGKSGEDTIIVTVTDTGCGLADDELPHVFERFWRSRRARETKGSGLGLTICERIVRRHGGAISVARRPGGGSIFSISLPGGGP